MWSILAGNGNRSSRGRLTRRDLLRIGAFGSGLTLADALRAGGAPPRKSAIMIYLDGGPSHLETYDLKPDAPAEIRGEFQPIATNVPGVRICKHFPRQARIWDKLACLRSVIGGTEHPDSQIMTGYQLSENRSLGHPSLGAVVSKQAAGASRGVPPFVTLRGMSAGCQPGLLGGAHRPFAPSRFDLQNLLPGLTLERLSQASGRFRLCRAVSAGRLNSLDHVAVPELVNDSGR